MTDIAAELAGRPPGGRNAAAYTAGLKAGSLLGAARATPGGEQAAAAWTDEAAEQALMDAAQRNGYVDKDGEAEARRAIRSGFRNGLRRPRALPDFTTSRPAQVAPLPPRPRVNHEREPAPAGVRDPGTIVLESDTPRMQANRAAVAANHAYRAGDLDAARQLIDQAAALDPSRADLWQQHREQIAARSLILDAQAAYADGDHQRVQDLLGQARQLDPRMPAIWDGDLPGLPSTRTAHHSREHAAEPGPAVQPVAALPSRAPIPGSKPAPPPLQRTGSAPAVMAGITSLAASRASRRQGQRRRPDRAQPIPARNMATPATAAGANRASRCRNPRTSDMQPGTEPADDDPSTR